MGGDSWKLRGPDLEFFATAKGGGIFREISPFEKGHGLHFRNIVFCHVNTFYEFITFEQYQNIGTTIRRKDPRELVFGQS
jgi:hypothetical protein